MPPKKQHDRPRREKKSPVSQGAELTIETCVHGGDGLARHDGKTYFVTGGLPGDVVKTGPIYKKGNCFFTEVTEVLVSSEMRRSPPCSLANDCGGCDWQHVKYPAQVDIKVSIFKDGLRRLGFVKNTENLVVETYFGKERAYRHRAQFKISESGEVGFFAKNSHEVIQIPHCPVLVDELNSFMNELNKEHHEHAVQLQGVSQIKAMAGSKGEVASHPYLPTLSVKNVEVEVNGYALDVSGQSFFQQNRELTPVLGKWVAEQCDGDFALDLFGGSGFFSLMIQNKVKKILLIERDPHLVDLAKKTFEKHGLSHLTAESMSAEAFFKSRAKSISAQTTVIVDPPRAGLGRIVCEHLSRLNMKQLIYVACDPATQARDIRWLSEMGGFEIKKAALFDLYPNTHHMETVLVLERTKLCDLGETPRGL